MDVALIVFDLDLTLWECGRALWCDQTTPPYELIDPDCVSDRFGSCIRLFPEVRNILEALTELNVGMALASRTSAPDQAAQLLELFKIKDYFPHQEIYPGDKKEHFRSLHAQTGVPFDQMRFYDDERRNIESVSELGVSCHLVTHGMSLGLLEKTKP